MMSMKKKTLNKAIKEASKILFYVEYESCNSLHVLQVLADTAKEAKKKANKMLAKMCLEYEIKNISAV